MAVKLDFESCLSEIPTSYATCSIGSSPEHTLPKKLDAISGAGFQGIELAFPDLVSFATQYLGKEIAPTDYKELCSAAKEVKRLCDEAGLQIVMLQPFSNFEGWEHNTKEREDAFKRAHGWIEVMRCVGTKMLQVMANYLHSV